MNRFRHNQHRGWLRHGWLGLLPALLISVWHLDCAAAHAEDHAPVLTPPVCLGECGRADAPAPHTAHHDVCDQTRLAPSHLRVTALPIGLTDAPPAPPRPTRLVAPEPTPAVATARPTSSPARAPPLP